ncbi:cysteine proteinase, partial [Mycena olivaceomarginata]
AKAADLEASFAQQEKRAGLLVTNELEKALADCKAQVERIAQDCRAKNRRFRDVEFDLENDRELCLFGLSKEDRELQPADVQRVTKIFSKPSFFVDGADSNDIVQGRLGDCWFLSALSTMTTANGMMEKFCVARDEKVGVYGWIFFRDSSWGHGYHRRPLFTSIPKFEELTQAEQALGGKSLYFARSAQEGETWVSLIEKAYAKLHGDYTSIVGGYSCEAHSGDILDPDVFWTEELLLATTDRLFGCGFDTLDSTRSGNRWLRNPWGDSEWTGKWSDGSKEWTEECCQHKFGDDGEFTTGTLVERTLIFDDTWVMANQWLQVNARAPSAAWSYGDISFTPFVLSKLDERYFSDISGNSCWTFDFTLFKKGAKELVARSSVTRLWLRSVNLEYVVHVRLDRQVNDEVQQYHPGNCNARKFSRVQTERAKSQSIAEVLANVPIPLEVLAGQDLTELGGKAVEAEKRLKAAEAALKKKAGRRAEGGGVTITVVSETTVAKTKAYTANRRGPDDGVEGLDADADGEGRETREAGGRGGGSRAALWCGSPVPVPVPSNDGSGSDSDSYRPGSPMGSGSGSVAGSGYDNDTVVLGLRVYTSKDAPAVVGGQLRHEMNDSAL